MTQTPSPPHPAESLSRAFSELTRELAKQSSVSDTLTAIARHAVEFVDGAEDAGITTWHGERHFSTVAATGELPRMVDSIQYSTQEGPCVEAVIEHHVVRSDDIATDPRWPVFGRLAADRTEVASMLSHRLYLEDEDNYGALNLYSRKPAAFSQHSLDILDLYAAHAAMALSRASAAAEAEHLQLALESNRTIGIAVGVLMTTYKISRDDAFGLLRVASQHNHRKLRDVAQDVVDTGVLDPKAIGPR